MAANLLKTEGSVAFKLRSSWSLLCVVCSTDTGLEG